MKIKRIGSLAVLAGVLVTGCQTAPPPAAPVPLTMLEQAQMDLAAGRYKEALHKAELVLQQNDQNTTAVYVRGMAAFGVNDLEVAKAVLSSVRASYRPENASGRELLKTLALTHFKLKEFEAAESVYGEFIAAKRSAGSALLDDDLYWAGVIADVNLENDQRDQWWSKLSTAFKKSKGIK